MPDTPPQNPAPSLGAVTKESLPSGRIMEKLADVSGKNFVLKNVIDALRADATKDANSQTNYVSSFFGKHTYSLNGEIINIPSFQFINFNDSQQAVMSDILAIVNHAIINGSPDVAFFKEFLNQANSKGFTEFVSVLDKGLSAGNNGTGGEAYSTPGDSQLESAVRGRFERG
ncbi:hypothetical protein [Novosphingobium aerophilum]|uniref:Uncharacterized protein n=1 Tax=Novosphingobium aerophilum TaxID=2839843 RepID=A0A7X1KDT4_9SPHN|nr:hypothetical protein [Novosphingobium aerophilum]MBC2653676.1 hypothetical protein [Novosphingobium aerophilum]